jgi:hypothetical protein
VLLSDALPALRLLSCLLFIVIIGVELLSGVQVRLPEFDRETPREWVERSAARWAVYNGSWLGCGWVTRIGFPSWYIAALMAAFAGTVLGGALILASYGFMRSLMSLVVGSYSGRRMDARKGSLAFLLLGWKGHCRRWSNVAAFIILALVAIVIA